MAKHGGTGNMKKRIMAVMLSVFLLTGNIPVTAAENTETIEMSDASETDATEAADGSTEEDTSAGNLSLIHISEPTRH